MNIIPQAMHKIMVMKAVFQDTLVFTRIKKEFSMMHDS